MKKFRRFFFQSIQSNWTKKKRNFAKYFFGRLQKTMFCFHLKATAFFFFMWNIQIYSKKLFFSEKFILKQNRFLFCGETCVQRMIVKAFYTKIRTISFTKRNNPIRLKKTFTQVLVFLDTVWNLLKDNFTKKGILCLCLPN